MPADTVALKLAQALFHRQTEDAFYRSKFLEYYNEFSTDTRKEFFRSKMTPVAWFFFQTMGIENVWCSPMLKEGCKNMPSDLDIRWHYRAQRHKARKIIFIKRAFIKVHQVSFMCHSIVSCHLLIKVRT